MDLIGFIAAVVKMLAVCMMLCGDVLFFLPSSQEICVSNHAQKHQAIHKDSFSHKALQVDDCFIMMWLYTCKALSVTLTSSKPLTFLLF